MSAIGKRLRVSWLRVSWLRVARRPRLICIERAGITLRRVAYSVCFPGSDRQAS